jgi:hypothetical protein
MGDVGIGMSKKIRAGGWWLVAVVENRHCQSYGQTLIET